MNYEPTSCHILGTFEAALTSLNEKVLRMAKLTQRSLENSSRGLIERNDEPCKNAIVEDAHIDDLEVIIDRDGIETLIRFNPVAGDMRKVLTAMKLSVHLERIADQSVGIARRALELNAVPAVVSEVNLIHKMLHHSISMFQDAFQAFIERKDVALALKIRDRELDKMNKAAAEELSEAMSKDISRVRTYLNLLFTARYIERIGDHSKNIAEDTVFLVSAQDIRHQITD